MQKADDRFEGETEILERAAQQYEISNPDFPIDHKKTAFAGDRPARRVCGTRRTHVDAAEP